MVFQVNLIDEITQLHDQLSAQLEEVAEVQRSILPASLPEHPNIDMDVFYRPSDYAGGDYYDFREFDDGSIGMVMADVAGHGPAASIVMAMMRTAMSVHNSLNLGGEKISQIINSFLQDGLRNGTFVTAFFFRLNTETGAVAYSNAGHSPAIRINKAGEISELDAPGNPPLGILPEITPKGAQLQLEPGDTILLYTDGISEVFNANNEQFGVDRLKESLKNNRGNAKKTIQGITHDMDAFRGSHAIRDDQCMLSIVWK
jgi:sigma-B regulation protein RsbU (phosphoserine phosphatase)